MTPALVPFDAGGSTHIEVREARVAAERVDQWRHLCVVELIRAHPRDDCALLEGVEWQSGAHIPQLDRLGYHGETRRTRALDELHPSLECGERRDEDRARLLSGP